MVKKSMNILIAGDSFAANWPNRKGWVDYLAMEFNVTNVAQAGVGEYKIFKQLENQDFSKFDAVIVSHTSPSRVHTRNHPLHKSGFHKDCDLIYNDIQDRCTLFNRNLAVSNGWFEYHYDDEYQIDIYNLIREKINNIITVPYISLSHIPIVNSLAIEKNHVDFSELWAVERGDSNHYTIDGNIAILKTIVNKIISIRDHNE